MKALLWVRLISLRKHKGILITMMILPIIFTFFFSMSGSRSAYSVGLVVEKENPLSKDWVKELYKHENLLITELNKDEIEEKLYDGRVEAVLVPEKGIFNNDLQDLSLQIYRTADTSTIQAIEQAVREVTMKVANEHQVAQEILSALAKPEQKEEAVYQYVSGELEEPIISVDKKVINEEQEVVYDTTFQALVGFTLFFTMYTIIFSLGEMIEDRQKGIMTRLGVSPVRTIQIYSANFLYSFLIGFIQVIILVTIGQYVFGIDWGDQIISVGIIIALYVLATMAYGMILCSLSRTMQQLSAITPVVAVSFAMLGGAYWPIEIVQNQILLTLANITPIYHAMNALKGVVLYDHSLFQNTLPLVYLTGMSLALLGLGIYMFKKRFN
ncbi:MULTISPECIES: ABC transporter permease [Pontibacillus]|uniref:ABC transporter permease n=1 Tax=Pontibacillus chungwhensis TaxID=265426 RepID=A0ABY8V699_9BACI|nr:MULTISPECIES: ABC transporter permease [Pontibacillus]MCD5322806.1 ABC transporter permease [Pontibacillus sp. HN14]WIG00076.1 ABC transporter permease [Pontibacillus chungwhensis]